MFEASELGSDGPGRGPAVGDVVSGAVISISSDAVFVDLGGKSEGVLAIDQVTDGDGLVGVSVGDTIRARVVDSGERTGAITLALAVGRGADAHGELQVAFEHGIPVEGVVTGVNKGGFDVQIAGARAFCPVSQMDTRFVDDPEAFVGRRENFRITRFEPSHRGAPNLVVSRRVLLEEAQAERAAETRERLEVGAVLRGKVTRIEDYGAFVDLGGIEGMLHVSELGFSRVKHPSEMLELEQELEVQVIKLERSDNPRRPEKVGLSLRALARDPWDDVRSALRVGELRQGTVVRIEQFGAFVELEPGLEGLVHISEMGGGERLSSPRKAVAMGQKVHVKLLSIDTERRRIALSMDAARREALAADERDAIDEFGPGSESLGTFADLLRDQLGKK